MVQKGKRNQGQFSVTTESANLLSMTYAYCNNESVIPKRHRHGLGNQIISAAEKIHSSLIFANNYRRDVPEELEMRRKLQLEAKNYLSLLSSLLSIIFEKYHINENILKNWNSSVAKVDSLLESWRKSDEYYIKNNK